MSTAVSKADRHASKRTNPQPIPMIDLDPLLAETQDAWRKYLGEVRFRMQFILGEQVQKFEHAFAEYSGAAVCVGCGSGTSAIELCLRAAHVTHSDQKVLLPALTSPFTAQAILAAGARPVFSDVDPETLLLDPVVAENAATDIAAIVPVHLYGQPCNLPALAKLARSKGAVLVQDACQAHGATYEGKSLSRFSSLVAYSFYPTKNLGCLGDGGAVITSSQKLAARLRLLRDGGRRGDQLSRVAAINSRLDEIQACFLRAFLPWLDHWNCARARFSALYDRALADCCDIKLIRHVAGSVHHLYVIRAAEREKLQEFLRKRGIHTSVHYAVPLHLHPAFKFYGTRRGSFPIAERAGREVLSLPLHPHIGETDVLRVAEAIRRFYS